MLIEGVDPRDIEWEVDDPVYRVYFWSPLGEDRPDVMYECESYRIRDVASVHDVIAWANDAARAEQTFTLYVEHRQVEHHRAGARQIHLGLIRLSGVNPTASA